MRLYTYVTCNHLVIHKLFEFDRSSRIYIHIYTYIVWLTHTHIHTYVKCSFIGHISVSLLHVVALTKLASQQYVHAYAL